MTLLEVLRLGLVVSLAASAAVQLWVAPLLNEVLRPHIYFVSLWMLVCAACMAAIAFGVGGVHVFEVVNAASILLFAGWALLVVRIGRRIRAAVRVKGFM